MKDIAIKTDNLSKKFRFRHHLEGSSLSIKEIIAQPSKWVKDMFWGTGSEDTQKYLWALKDISFEVKKGESVGLIGRNGAGKSTLLRILSRIMYPTTGRVYLYENVTSLLAMGTGFNPELTGRDNVYLNGTLLGMSQEEILQNFNEIVSFSELQDFIDTPVKYYSSGMFVRLAFSVAVHLNPELLLLDEILAVGDAKFQEKSFQKMKDLLSRGSTLIFVSHNPQAIKDICQRAIYLRDGKIALDGPASSVVDAYLQDDIHSSREKPSLG